MATFTPPTTSDRPSFLPDTDARPWEKGFWKYVHPANYYSRYVSVFQLSDGTFVQDTATPGFTNTNIPYPWDVNVQSAPYAVAEFTDVSVTPPVLVSETFAHTVYILRVFTRPSYVDAATAALLTTAGYGSYLT